MGDGTWGLAAGGSVGGGPESGGPEGGNRRVKSLNSLYHINNLLVLYTAPSENTFPYPEAGQSVWPVHWAQVVGRRGGCLGWAEEPRDAPLGWVWVLQGEREVVGEIEGAY